MTFAPAASQAGAAPVKAQGAIYSPGPRSKASSSNHHAVPDLNWECPARECTRLSRAAGGDDAESDQVSLGAWQHVLAGLHAERQQRRHQVAAGGGQTPEQPAAAGASRWLALDDDDASGGSGGSAVAGGRAAAAAAPAMPPVTPPLASPVAASARMRAWMDSVESRRAGAAWGAGSSAAGQVVRALPPPAFVIMGVL